MRKQAKQTQFFAAVTMSMNTHGTLNVSALLHDNSKLEMNVTRFSYKYSAEDVTVCYRDTVTTNTGFILTDIANTWDVENETADQPEVYKLYMLAHTYLEAVYELPKPATPVVPMT